MGRLQTLAQIILAVREGRFLGDVSVLKLSLFQKQEKETRFAEALRALEERNFEELVLPQIEVYPKASFGEAYLHFMRENNLRPINFSSNVRSLYERFPVAIRYARIHDMVHTLLGFGAKVDGELGVYAFVAAQDYTRVLNRAYLTGRLVARLLRPFSWRHLRDVEARGRALAIGAKPLIAEPLEDYLPLPLHEVRERLLPAAMESAGTRPA